VVGVRGGFDLELAIDGAQRRVELQWELLAGGVQLAAHLQLVVLEDDRL
jgi:hypothetical protein